MSKGEQTKQKIIDQALYLFSKKGYEETSLRDIAVRVNIKAPSIYAYFSSKEDLFENVTSHVMKGYLLFIKNQAQNLEGLSIEGKLYMLMEELNKYFFKHDLGLFIKRYGLMPPEGFKDFMLQTYQESEKEIRKVLYATLEENPENYVDTETVVTSFMCILDGMFFNMIHFSEEEYNKKLKASWDVFWRGINK